MNTLTEEQDTAWQRLKHVPTPFVVNLDVNGLYPWQTDTVLALNRTRIKGDPESVTIRVLKNRR